MGKLARNRKYQHQYRYFCNRFYFINRFLENFKHNVRIIGFRSMVRARFSLAKVLIGSFQHGVKVLKTKHFTTEFKVVGVNSGNYSFQKHFIKQSILQNSSPKVQIRGQGYNLQSSIALIPFCHAPVFQTGYTLCVSEQGTPCLLNRVVLIPATAQEFQLRLVSCLLTSKTKDQRSKIKYFIVKPWWLVSLKFIILPKTGKITGNPQERLECGRNPNMSVNTPSTFLHKSCSLWIIGKYEYTTVLSKSQ